MWLPDSKYVLVLAIAAFVILAPFLVALVGWGLKEVFPGRCTKCKTKLEKVKKKVDCRGSFVMGVPDAICEDTVWLCPQCKKGRIDRIKEENNRLGQIEEDEKRYGEEIRRRAKAAKRK